MKIFLRKSTALKYKKENEILCNTNIDKYFLQNSYADFLNLITNTIDKIPNYYEFVPEASLCNLFFDIEIYKDKSSHEYESSNDIVLFIKNTLQNIFINYIFQFIVLDSHNSIKKSYHIIVRFFDSKSTPIYFKNVKLLKWFISQIKDFKSLKNDKILDVSVYREGLFRTYLSSKSGENRPLVKSNDLSDNFEEIETFVCWRPNNSEDFIFDKDNLQVLLQNYKTKSNDGSCSELSRDLSCTKEDPTDIIDPGDNSIIIEPVQKDLTEKDKDIITKFVRKHYKYKTRDIRDIFIDHEYNCIIIALTDKFCYNIDREHKSNNQYIIIDTYSSKQKCHDLDCTEYKYEEIKINNFPKELNEIILKCLKVNKQEQELIEKAIQDCKEYILENFDENIHEIQFDKQQMIFRGDVSNGTNFSKILKGKCPECNVEHQISDTGYCLKCKTCNSIFPKNQVIPVEDRYKNLNNFWMNYSQLINNGTVNININNFYNGEEEFSCDIQLDTGIIKDKKILKILNECLDGHKITKLAELMHNIYKNYIYTGNDWYMFDNNRWVLDQKSLNFKKNILELCNLFNKIKQHYETKRVDDQGVGLIKNIKSLITKINKPQLKEDILKESQLFFIDSNFFGRLNSKKHLIPFSNGVYDLLENRFRKASKDDFINLTVNYDYNAECNNPEVHEFINKILPNMGVRDYVLKKLSECLNGDIPNTNFLMFIGDGANGKSQLLNLMKATMGEIGEKVEVTLLTRKRNNANEANTEKIKLMNKRFAFLSEPEDGEKINIGLLKELTGSEEIVARGLYQDSLSFVMEAKLFLACNELPEIKGEDTALWRRIRVIDFPSRFVDEPKDYNEYKIDRTLPSRMREDITWRRSFMNILLDYYYKDISEPIEVKVKTNEYRDENSPFLAWLNENIVEKEDAIVNLKDICILYFGKDMSKREKTKIKKEVEKYISKTFPNIHNLCKESRFNGVKYNGWKGICLTENL